MPNCQQLICRTGNPLGYRRFREMGVTEWAGVAAAIRPLLKRGDQKVIASRLGLTDAALSRYLDAERIPDPVVAARICALVDRDLGELIGLREPGSPQPAIARTPEAGGRELHGVGAPLVAIDVAAGDGALTEVSDDRVYFFGQRYMSSHGWTERSKDRFCCIKLGSASVAESMEPTIPHGSLLLIDRRPAWERIRAKAREIYLVRMPGEKEAVKRCTLVGEEIILESDNPAPKHHPRSFSVTGENWREFVRGRVLWWSVEA